MNVGLVLVLIGVAVWLAMYGFRALFVDRADKENPYRTLVKGAGYLALAIAAWGLVLLLFAGEGGV
jgi:hypothetical protein